jgi:hypothetical protein
MSERRYGDTPNDILIPPRSRYERRNTKNPPIAPDIIAPIDTIPTATISTCGGHIRSSSVVCTSMLDIDTADEAVGTDVSVLVVFSVIYIGSDEYDTYPDRDKNISNIEYGEIPQCDKIYYMSYVQSLVCVGYSPR